MVLLCPSTLSRKSTTIPDLEDRARVDTGAPLMEYLPPVHPSSRAVGPGYCGDRNAARGQKFLSRHESGRNFGTTAGDGGLMTEIAAYLAR